MLIISQNKKRLANLNKVSRIDIEYNLDGEGKTHIAFSEENHYCYLGEYSTEERAKEILLDIANAYGRGIKVYEMPEK